MGEAESSSLIVQGRNVIVTEVVERAIAERPVHDTIEQIMEWLIGGARQVGSFARTIDELSWRLAAAGIPVLRVSLRGGTLHPQFLGAFYVWWRSSAQTQEIMITHEVADLIPPAQNPVLRVQGGEILRRRLEGPEARLDFSVLHDLKARGATDYYALPVGGAFGPRAYMAAYVTDRPGGFLEREIADLAAVSERLSIVADMNSQRQIAENVLKAYLGPQTGRKVLAGQIRRGSGEAIAAVLWSSDLRRFTQMSDRLPGENVIGILNDLFDLQAKAIVGHGGEILKFVGDGLLAIFPVTNPDQAARTAANALAAAQEALAALDALRAAASAAGEPPLEIVIALHYGTVIYGNIGAADRLDFTVIGPAVNLVSRIEAIAKSRDLPLIVSDDFANAYGGGLASLGLHRLRGLDLPHELFTPPDV
ncbi:MAG: Adenylate cyclase [Bradyrhizobium sp.]|nr:Adenylate cyclase [Bradyrhizobium sp.]